MRATRPTLPRTRTQARWLPLHVLVIINLYKDRNPYSVPMCDQVSKPTRQERKSQLLLNLEGSSGKMRTIRLLGFSPMHTSQVLGLRY